MFVNKIGQHFSTSEDLLGPIIMPLFLEKGIDLFDSLIEDDQHLFSCLSILNFILTSCQELADLLLDIWDEFQLHLVLEVKYAFCVLRTRVSLHVVIIKI